jgi:thiamine-phosphate pyrophosphorylase
MHRRQPLPRLWMMTDERQREGLWTAIDRLPRGAGIVFRHYSLGARERHDLFLRVRRLARRKRLLLVLAGPPRLALAWGADGYHGRAEHPRHAGPLLRSAPVHDHKQMLAAERADADLVFVSPVHATRSHRGSLTLGVRGFAALARLSRVPVIALGGMDAARMRALAGAGAYGWAGIDAWSAG